MFETCTWGDFESFTSKRDCSECFRIIWDTVPSLLLTVFLDVKVKMAMANVILEYWLVCLVVIHVFAMCLGDFESFTSKRECSECFRMLWDTVQSRLSIILIDVKVEVAKANMIVQCWLVCLVVIHVFAM
jgi:hypothetical protein